ncbi:hypothetical protein ALT_9485 [Aspergillus lentulus]|uniref:BTB domain-containing protein n=1 Tax=Aspergillus lentulus TaxID=293939 RepID=A0AAN4PTH8_ASPLE|nr:hypothetical protein ALT_9485 [Aspergillus lentulus]
MTGAHHILDPDGDLVLVFSVTNRQTVILNGNIAQEPSKQVTTADSQTSWFSNQPAAAEQIGQQETSKDANEEQRVYMRVSSKHLALASPVFRRTLCGPWQEAQNLAAEDRSEIETECWNVDAMLILMNIIHGRGPKVPREITLNTLAEIAVLVDYYECYEAVDVMAEIWMDKLLNSMPSTYCKDIVSWIFISWVFERRSAFTSATRIAATQSQQRIDPADLPIPQRILDKIEEHRRDGVKSALDMCYKLITDLRDGRKHCSEVCDALRLGLLIKQLHAGGQLPPLPADSIPNVSLLQLTTIARRNVMYIRGMDAVWTSSFSQFFGTSRTVCMALNSVHSKDQLRASGSADSTVSSAETSSGQACAGQVRWAPVKISYESSDSDF